MLRKSKALSSTAVGVFCPRGVNFFGYGRPRDQFAKNLFAAYFVSSIISARDPMRSHQFFGLLPRQVSQLTSAPHSALTQVVYFQDLLEKAKKSLQAPMNLGMLTGFTQ